MAYNLDPSRFLTNRYAPEGQELALYPTGQNGNYREFQRYLCENCDRTFNNKAGTIVAHLKIGLRRWLFSVDAFLRFNTSPPPITVQDRRYSQDDPAAHRRSGEALNAPSLNLV